MTGRSERDASSSTALCPDCPREVSEARQVSTLLYCLGEEAEDVLTSANDSEVDKKARDCPAEARQFI